mgnify:CR=1 FL=1
MCVDCGCADCEEKELSVNQKLNKMALVTWEVFRPNGDDEILQHYYASSPGVKGTKLNEILSGVVAATVTSLAGPAVGGASGVAYKMAVDAFGNAQRKNLDSGAEKQRIIKYYRDAYARDDFGISHASEWSAEKLESKIQDISLDLEKVRVGCGNGDTAGCRYFGVRYAALSYAVLALQYKKVGESLKGTGVLGNPTAIDVSPGGVLVDKVAGADAKLSGWVSDLNNGTAGSASDSEDSPNILRKFIASIGIKKASFGWLATLLLIGAAVGMFFKGKSKY